VIIVLGLDIGEREAKRSSGAAPRRSKFVGDGASSSLKEKAGTPRLERATPSEELGVDVARAKGWNGTLKYETAGTHNPWFR